MSHLRATASEFTFVTHPTSQASGASLRPAANEFVPTGFGFVTGTEKQEPNKATMFHPPNVVHPNGNSLSRPTYFHPPNVLTEQRKSLDASAACFVPQIPAGTAIPNQGTTTGNKPICRFFAQGSCKHGLQCKFSHDTSLTTLNVNEAAQSNGHQKPTKPKEQGGANGSLVSVDNGIRCHFGPGLEVLSLELGTAEDKVVQNDCKRIHISGLSESTTDFDLEARLSTFGAIQSIHRKQASFAFCTFESNKQAADAVAGLNGTPQATWNGVVAAEQTGKHKRKEKMKEGTRFVSVSLASEGGQANDASRNALVKLQWYAPSRVAWLHFNTRQHAAKAAQSCNGKVFSKRAVAAKMQQPNFNQTRSFSVWIGGLGEVVNKTKLSQFVKKHCGIWTDSIDLEAPSYRDTHL